jgi:hypothetical protein
MFLPTTLASDPHLVLPVTAPSLQTSSVSPNDNHSSRLSRSTTLLDISSTPLQSAVQVRSPSQLESNTENLVDISDSPVVIQLIRLHQALLWLVVVQVKLLVVGYGGFILILHSLN